MIRNCFAIVKPRSRIFRKDKLKTLSVVITRDNWKIYLHATFSGQILSNRLSRHEPALYSFLPFLHFFGRSRGPNFCACMHERVNEKVSPEKIRIRLSTIIVSPVSTSTKILFSTNRNVSWHDVGLDDVGTFLLRFLQIKILFIEQNRFFSFSMRTIFPLLSAINCH